MTKILKKLIIIISTILICMFIGTISSEAITEGDISNIKKWGRNAIGKTYYIQGYTIAGPSGLINKNFYCVQHNYRVDKNSPQYRINYYAEITGTTATIYGSNGKIATSTNNCNAQMAYILSKKAGHGTWGNVTYAQQALWLVWNDFTHNLANKMPTTSVSGVSEDNSVYNSAINYANTIKNDSIGVVDITNENNLKKVYENTNIIGPFSWKFTGNAEIEIVGYDNNNNSSNELRLYDGLSAKDKSLGKNVDYTTKLNSETNYYIDCVSSDIVKIEVKIKNTARTGVLGAKIWYFATTQTKYKHYQNVIFTDTSSTTESQIFKYSYKVNQGSILVKKVDADKDEYLTGMKFTVQNSEGKYLTLEGEYVDKYDEATCDFEITDSAGTKIEGLKYDTYTITEKEAPEGYNINLQTDKVKKVTIDTNDSSKEVEVIIENRKYGDLRLIKVDSETGDGIQGIKFKIGVVKGEHVDENGKTVIDVEYIKSYECTEGNPATIETTSNKDEAHLFITNDKGMIELDNIPVGKYTYEEDTASMINAGYLNKDGGSEGTTGEITVIARDSSNNYASVLYNILNSDYFRNEIVSKELTNVELAQRVYNAIMELIGNNQENNQEIDLTNYIDLLIERISLANTEINENIRGLNGDNVYETAVNIADNLYSVVANVENVVIFQASPNTYGERGIDGVPSSTLASIVNAPILLVEQTSIPSVTKAKLKEYKNLKNIYIVGKVDEKVEEELKKLASITYFGGQTRYNTCIEVAKKIKALTKNDTSAEKGSAIFVYGTTNEKDSLMEATLIAGLATSKKIPIVYIHHDVPGVPTLIKDYISSEGIKKAYLIGDNAVKAYKKLVNGENIDKIKTSVSETVEISGDNVYEENINIVNKFYCNQNEDGTFKLKDSVNRIILLEKSENNVLEMLASSQLLKDGNTVLFLIPETTKDTKEDTKFTAVKNLVQPIINKLIDKGEIYTLCNQEIINEVVSWYKEDISNYEATELTKLLHKNCISTIDGDTTMVRLSCSHESCKTGEYTGFCCNGYCYETYIDLLVSVILNTENTEKSTNSDELEKIIKESTEEELYEKIEKFFENILDKKEANKIDIDYYVGQLLGKTVVTVTNKFAGGSVTVIKRDALNDKKPLSAGFKLYTVDAKDNKQYLQINSENTGKSNEITSNGTDAIVVEALNYTTDSNKATVIVTSETNGKAELTRLAVGTYYLEETTTAGKAYPLELQDNKTAEVTIEAGSKEQMTITNKSLVNLEIKKVDENGNKIENVEFKIKGKDGYIVIKGTNKVKGKITIDYSTKEDYSSKIDYTGSKEEATIFITDSNGITGINNLFAGTYTITETKNENYGFILKDENVIWTIGGENKGTGISKEVTLNSENSKEITTATITVKNEQSLGNLSLIKKDENGNVMENMAFTIARKIDGTTKYLQISEGSTIKKELKSTNPIEINLLNNKTANGKSVYNVNYVDSVNDATEFLTNSAGKIEISNLEKYNKNLKEYTYVITETGDKDTSRFGYVVEGEAEEIEWTVGNNTHKGASCETKLIDGETVSVSVKNERKYVKLSGYVWLEGDNGTKDGKYSKTNDLKVKGIEVNLYEKNNSTPIATATTDESGKYVFNYKIDDKGNKQYLVEKSKLENYYVTFTYDGLEYEAVEKDTDSEGGSKATDIGRDDLNNRFKEVTVGQSGGVAVGQSEETELEYSLDTKKGTATYINDWEYSKDPENPNLLKVTKQGSKFAINATTENEYTLSIDKIKDGEITNINFGIKTKEQPDLQLDEDLVSAKVNINKKSYTYIYNGNLKTTGNATVRTKKNIGGTYTSEIYPEDQNVNTGENRLIIDLYYEIKVTNSSNFTTKVNSIINYYENICEYKGWASKDDENEKAATLSYSIDEIVTSNVNESYNSVKIPCNIALGANESKSIYVHYIIDSKDMTLGKAIENDVTIDNVSEIYSYTTYKDEKTYAGIDIDSAPGNYNMKEYDTQGENEAFEDDTALAKSLKIVHGIKREISGVVWLDEKNNGVATGNGKIDDSEESRIENVKVELVDIDTGETKQKAITNEKGEYTITGFIPGNYKLRFTYGDVDNDNDKEINYITKIAGTEKEINVRNYKSAILNEESTVRKIFENEEQNSNWILAKEGNYNDAIDNLETREEIDKQNTIKNTTIENEKLSMDACTAKFIVGVEATEKTESNIEDVPEEYSVKNIDFGIIERPKQNAEISKEITYIKLVLSNGQVLIEGNPTKDATITYVKTGLDGTVPMEIDFELLPATVEVQYTITVTDTSEVDYVNSDGTCNEKYYCYGEKSDNAVKRTIEINKIVDYLPSELIYDAEKTKIANNNQECWETTYTAQMLKENGLISDAVEGKVNSGYTVLVTNNDVFSLTKENPVSVKLYATTTITSTAKDIRVVNYTEIIDYNSTTLITDDSGKISTPGNLVPGESDTYEADDDNVDFVITPPTGENKDYTTYYILGVSVLLILGLGIVLIKKKVINK